MDMDNGSLLFIGLEQYGSEEHFTHPHEYEGMIEQLHDGLLNLYRME